jgi:hypothetical protein
VSINTFYTFYTEEQFQEKSCVDENWAATLNGAIAATNKFLRHFAGHLCKKNISLTASLA